MDLDNKEIGCDGTLAIEKDFLRTFFYLLYNGMRTSVLTKGNDGNLGHNEVLKVEVGEKKCGHL